MNSLLGRLIKGTYTSLFPLYVISLQQDMQCTHFHRYEMFYLVLKDKMGKSNTASVGADSIAMPAGRRKPRSLERREMPLYWGVREAPVVGREGTPAQRKWGGRWERGDPGVSHFPGRTGGRGGGGKGGWEAISPNISGEAEKPGGRAGPKGGLGRFGWRTRLVA